MLPPDLLFLLSFSMGCALYDLKTGKISNFFVLCGLLCGSATLLLSCAGASLSTIFRIRFPVFNLAQPDPASCILGFLLPSLLFGLPALLGMIGGGDVKLLSVAGLFLGAEAVWNVIQTSVLIGAVYAGFVLVRHRNGYQRFMFLRNYLCEVASVLRSRQTPPASLPAVSHPSLSLSNIPPSGAAHAGPLLSHPRLRRYRSAGTADAEFCFSVPIFLALLFHTLLAQFP